MNNIPLFKQTGEAQQSNLQQAVWKGLIKHTLLPESTSQSLFLLVYAVNCIKKNLVEIFDVFILCVCVFVCVLPILQLNLQFRSPGSGFHQGHSSKRPFSLLLPTKILIILFFHYISFTLLLPENNTVFANLVTVWINRKKLMLILAVSYRGPSFTSIYLLYLCVCTFHHGYTWLCPCSSHLTFYPPLSPCAIRLSISPHWNYPDYDYSHDDNDNHCKIALSFSHIQHPGDYDWLKGCLQIIHLFFSTSLDLSLFLTFYYYYYYLAFSYFPCSLHSSFAPSPAHPLSSVFFNLYGSLSSLLLCSFQPPSYLCHLSTALPFAHGFQPLICSLIPLSSLFF